MNFVTIVIFATVLFQLICVVYMLSTINDYLSEIKHILKNGKPTVSIVNKSEIKHDPNKPFPS